MTESTAYGWLMLAGIFMSLALWWRMAKRDARLVLIYIAALAGAFLGAKLVYLGAEGWLHWRDANRWLILATGKSITGAMLGGYAAVEIAKRLVGYTTPTGDWFAVIAPVGIMVGRVGCLLHGCCLGRVCEANWFTINDTHSIARWPAAQVELLFNAIAFVGILLLRGRTSYPVVQEGLSAADRTARSTNESSWRTQSYILQGQHFHLYLMAYGSFRFAHEFLRATPQVIGPFSGYQIAALGVVGLGLVGFLLRHRLLRQRQSKALIQPIFRADLSVSYPPNQSE